MSDPPPPVGTLIDSLPHNGPGKLDVIIESILLFLVYVTFALRLWSRQLQRASLQINDWLIMAAVPLMTIRYAMEVAAVLKCGLGLHIDEVMLIGGPDILVLFTKLVYIADLLWVTLVTLIKVSILHFYLVIFRQPIFMRSVYVVMGICVAWWIGSLFGTAFFCNPPENQFSLDPADRAACGDSNTLYSAVASSDLAIDVIVIALPMPVLWSLQLPTAKKFALTLVFGIGFVIIAITAVRIKFMLELDQSDITYSASQMALLSACVPLLGIINANLPILPPAFKRVFNSTALSTSFRKTSHHSSSSQSNQFSSTRSRQFERLAEPEMPLVHMANNSKVDSQLSVPSNLNPDMIRVTTEWDVSSQVDVESQPHSRQVHF